MRTFISLTACLALIGMLGCGSDCETCKACGDGGVASDCGAAKNDCKACPKCKEDGNKPPDDVLQPDTQPDPMAKVALNELMLKPAKVPGAGGQWFEIINLENKVISLDGWTLEDESGTEKVKLKDDKTTGQQTAMDPGAFLVFAFGRDHTSNGGVVANYGLDPSKFKLEPGDSIVIRDLNGTEVDRVRWDPTKWAGQLKSGQSMALKVAQQKGDNSKASAWCLETTKWATSAGDKGSPGGKTKCK